jgi:alpha-amylase/alpha-mannosidase (GH57 family)
MPVRSICIHGHFYQPPRENAWLEAVETQDGAHPYHDWNERITEECYAQNASSRILDANDRITKIVNNYASISFNFGPTLLSWLEERAPETYDAVIHADRISRERSGHGNAIAQAYNHMIMPLATPRDRRTQVRWGVRDFEHRFGHKPDGMWLPETAVDIDSLEALAEEGIRFTILEPSQAIGAIDPARPYRCPLPSGKSIVIFFYDGPISRAVAFENLLARGEYLAHRLLGAPGQLVNIATDGETYGHHHRFGDMALAYAIDYITQNNLARAVNYACYLDDNPPVDDVQIRERTSWSCIHGVGRWERDCGCNAGAPAGWNQQWRTPLREALDWLRDECAVIFETAGARVLRDPWLARDDYIDVILDRSDDNVDAFLAKHAIDNDSTAALELLEMQRNAMLMFTSCGWFFNEVSGIETVQVLQYAARVIQLAEKITGRNLEPEFLDRVGEARPVYERQVKPTRLDLRRVAAHYAVASLFDSFGHEDRVYCYGVRQEDFETFRAGRAKMAAGLITVTSRITREEAAFEFTVIHLGETELTGGVRPATSAAHYEAMKRDLSEDLRVNGVSSVIRVLDEYFAEPLLSIRSLFRDEQRRILNFLCNATLGEAESAFRQLHERYDPLMRFHATLGVPLPKVLRIAAEFDVNTQLRRLAEADETSFGAMEQLLREARDEGVALDETTLIALTRAVERAAEEFCKSSEDLERLERWEAVVSLVRAADVRIDLRKPQDAYYHLKKSVRPLIAASSSASAVRWLQRFDALGEKLSIA